MKTLKSAIRAIGLRLIYFVGCLAFGVLAFLACVAMAGIVLVTGPDYWMGRKGSKGEQP